MTYNALSGKVEQVRDLSGKVRYVTAGDVAYGIKRVLNPDTSSGNAFILDPIQSATYYNTGSGSADAVGIIAVDDYTLVINLKAPNRAIEVIADSPFMAAEPSWQI